MMPADTTLLPTGANHAMNIREYVEKNNLRPLKETGQEIWNNQCKWGMHNPGKNWFFKSQKDVQDYMRRNIMACPCTYIVAVGRDEYVIPVSDLAMLDNPASIVILTA